MKKMITALLGGLLIGGGLGFAVAESAADTMAAHRREALRHGPER